jgi:aminoglycoside phosphotransferase (APT) family kinase protein
MDQDNLYTVAHPHFFESISRIPLSPEYVDRLKELVPEEWVVHRWDVWVGAVPTGGGGEAREQGFKIHVSSTTRHALRVLELVVPELVRRRIGFKIAGDPRLLGILISKRVGRGGSGKFMTIYPPDDDTFRELIEAIHQKTRDEEVMGPYILSDRRYKDSKVVFYRYGGFRPRSILKMDGTRSSVITSPTGEFQQDERTPFFQLPPWVEDPFGGSETVEYEGTPVLKKRYEVNSVIVFSNSGGVYRGTDLQNGREVVIKEARPLSHFWESDAGAVDAVALLEREYRVLQRLEPLGFAPEPIDFFTEWEHAFLVEGYVAGRTFQQFWANDAHILAPFVHRPGRIESFVPTFQRIASSLIDAVERIHGRGVILGDLSPNNVFVEMESLALGLIDFESAHLSGDREEFALFTRTWGTAGYADVARRAAGTELSPADDFYALGMLLYSAVVPVQNFFALYEGARESFIEHFIALGVPVQVKDAIWALLEARVDDARAALAELAEWEAPAPADVQPAYA